MKTLSNGQPSTLGNYLDLCKAFELPAGTSYFEEQINKAAKGRDEEVLADESQMLYLIATMERKKK